MISLLHGLARNGDISWLSFYFAAFIADQSQTDIDDLPSLSAAIVSEANLAGNTCIRLDSFYRRPLFNSSRIDAAEIPVGIDGVDWAEKLHSNICIGDPQEHSPLILDGGRLYLNRYWFYEDFIARKIGALLQRGNNAERSQVSQQVDSLYASTKSVDDDQINAVKSAASGRFSVISGGPGSGKTSTVVRILAVLLMRDPQCRIALAAPTGKAAARMMASINQCIDQDDIDTGIRQSIPRQAQTIHRLLRYRHRGFDYHEQHPLPVDCVVIDEASMIDLKLMYQLLTALPDHARLILLGDRDQLASVAAGNVLGDITGHGLGIDSGTTAISASIALLRHNYRFNQDSAIGEVAALVNQGERDAAMTLLGHNDKGLRWYEEGGDQIHAAALDWLYDAYQPIFSSDTPADALKVYEKTRVLCANNEGPLGVVTLNRMVSTTLLARNNLPAAERFSGLPIMITRNHHALGLFNGDTGILWQYEDGLRACFRDSKGGFRDLAINRLPDFTPAWAGTVHKSQGSEFDSVLLILPSDPASEVLSRELMYTAVTRARRQFILHAPRDVVSSTIENLTERHSGLAQRLGWPDRENRAS